MKSATELHPKGQSPVGGIVTISRFLNDCSQKITAPKAVKDIQKGPTCLRKPRASLRREVFTSKMILVNSHLAWLTIKPGLPAVALAKAGGFIQHLDNED